MLEKAFDRCIEVVALLGQRRFRAALRKLQMWLGRREGRFTIIYEDNLWLSQESRSGPGSEVGSTQNIRDELPALLKRLEVSVLLDAPCGDFNWMRLVDLAGTRYIGIDIVRDVIEKNRVMYADSNREFLHRDLLAGSLPKADLILCRDCLIHFSYQHTMKAIDAFKQTGAEYILTNTYDSVQENQNIRTGNWRPINLMLPPYCFPAPVSLISESREQKKFLALYELQNLGVRLH